MNKYLIKSALCALLAVPVMTSCELDQMPEDALGFEQSWSTFERAKKQYVGLQARLRSVSGGACAYVSEIQADLFSAAKNAVSLNQVYSWKFTTEQFDGDIVWGNNFFMVKQANDFLNHMPQYCLKEPKTAKEFQQSALANRYLSAAHFSIAYAYTNMMVRYCKDYEPATAANELGLPLVTPDMTEHSKPSRASLEATVGFIREHLHKADSLMGVAADLEAQALENAQSPDDAKFTVNMNGSTTEVGLDTYRALECRLDLYTHKYEEAIQIADELTPNYQLASDAKQLQELWLYDTSSEIIFQPLQTPDERVITYSPIWVSYDIREDKETKKAYIHGANPYYIPTQGLINLFESSDLRASMYFTNPFMGEQQLAMTYGDLTAAGVQFWKLHSNPNLYKDPEKEGPWGSPYVMAKAFRSAELYLIAAESSLKKASRDEDAARGYLNELRAARGASEIQADCTGDELDQMMEDEWAREFAGEGFRLDCLKRWHKGFTRMKAQSFPVNILRPDALNLKVEANDKRFVWEIPSQDLQANSNLVPNWK